jgi:hypothetical protein
LKERTKKLLDFGIRGLASEHAKEQKSFASFLQKRRPFLNRIASPILSAWLDGPVLPAQAMPFCA